MRLRAIIGRVGLTAKRRVSLEPHPDGWRASLSRPLTLPHYPTVLHRGGSPAGS